MHNNFIELVEKVEKLANDELERANKEHPLFHSLHEGYAVLQEEIDEVIEINKEAMENKEVMWTAIKNDLEDEAVRWAKKTQICLTEATAEMIQCIAMCKKIIESEKNYEQKANPETL